ncbi:MAG TPA: glycosyl hydrolase family 65 protein, partial [Gemmatimonadales bacterium]|nr:glycosyl hydrolase family 65 protein [Gemmatimonadales bacterium]
LRGETLRLEPCIPKSWPSFEVAFRYHSARYGIVVDNPRGVMRGVSRIELDGSTLPANAREIPLAADGAVHRIRVELG